MHQATTGDRPATTQAELTAALAGPGLPAVDLHRFILDDSPEEFLPFELVRRYRAVPLYREKGTERSGERGALVVAMEDPLDADKVQLVRFATSMRIIPVGASSEGIQYAIDVYRGRLPHRSLLNELSLIPPGGALELLEMPGRSLQLELREAPEAPLTAVAENDNEVVQLANRIILDAFHSGASDIHLEPLGTRGDLLVRVRCDGLLRDILTVPLRHHAALVSRIKVMAALDISERRKAQDGKIAFKRFGPAEIELRVATIPLSDGLEGVVLRILSSARALAVDDLGMAEPVLRRVRDCVREPHGLIVVCGPTGSGKTTTLHSLLGLLNTGERKVWTAEDPIEITQKGLSQVQVDPRRGWTFANALRALLRADPDVIMVGEMRDQETATIAVEASLTGHLVMSTLHTNSAPDAVTRLVDMGVDRFSCGDALLGVLAQRLVRRLCNHCRRRQAITPGERACFREAALEVPADAALAKSVGCAQCGHTGYRGRLAVYEWMPMTTAVRACLQSGGGSDALRACAVAEGMSTLRRDGLEKVLLGLTSLEQVHTVCGLGKATFSAPAIAPEDPPFKDAGKRGLRLVR